MSHRWVNITQNSLDCSFNILYKNINSKIPTNQHCNTKNIDINEANTNDEQNIINVVVLGKHVIVLLTLVPAVIKSRGDMETMKQIKDMKTMHFWLS